MPVLQTELDRVLRVADAFKIHSVAQISMPQILWLDERQSSLSAKVASIILAALQTILERVIVLRTLYMKSKD